VGHVDAGHRAQVRRAPAGGVDERAQPLLLFRGLGERGRRRAEATQVHDGDAIGPTEGGSPYRAALPTAATVRPVTSPPLRTGYALLQAWVTAALGLLFVVDVVVVVAPLVLAVVPHTAPFETAWFGPRPPLAQVGLSATALLLLPVLAHLVRVRTRPPASTEAVEEQRRRIERDLHDGAQLRLTAVAMALGIARAEDDAGAVRAQVDRAYDQARLALAELRELVHGLQPRQGLRPALTALAERSPVPLHVEVALPARPPAAVETAAWFVATEAVANIAKHSGACRAWVRCTERAGVLRLEVGDDGRGGADPLAGTGLRGLEDRVAVLGGRMRLCSPEGGPTVLTAELPCAR
jgi:signal transduction histidine kinase